MEFARVLAGDTGVGSLLHVVGLGQVAEAVWGPQGVPPPGGPAGLGLGLLSSAFVRVAAAP